MVVVMFADTEGMKLVAAKSDLEIPEGPKRGESGQRVRKSATEDWFEG